MENVLVSELSFIEAQADLEFMNSQMNEVTLEDILASTEA